MKALFVEGKQNSELLQDIHIIFSTLFKENGRAIKSIGMGEETQPGIWMVTQPGGKDLLAL